MWPDDLGEPSGLRVQAFCQERGIGAHRHHASGHAYVPDLQDLVAAFTPARVVPIHSAATERFEDFFPHVERPADEEWWGV